MSLRTRLLGLAAGAAGVAVAGTAVEVARRRRVIARRGVGDSVAFGSFRSPPTTVVTDDGVPLYVEVDELLDAQSTRRRRADSPGLTVVFVHGYALNLDCWHFQRAGYRGLVRTVFYDQRSHGRSGRSSEHHATIDQLGTDLALLIEKTVPEGPVVLVGHSMGGMSIIALAEQHPELFGTKVVGTALISTTAGGLSPHRALLPILPAPLGGQVASRVVAGLARGSRVIEAARRLSRSVVLVATDRYAFGEDVPESYVAFVDEMLSGTPFDVIAEFFPSFGALDKFAVLAAFERIPTLVICGTRDKITPIGLSRKLEAHIPTSTLVECEGAGHMVMMERHEQVNAALDQLLAAAAAHTPDVR